MQRFEVTKLCKAGRSAIGYPNFLFDRPAIGYPNFLFDRLISNWHFLGQCFENLLYSIIKGWLLDEEVYIMLWFVVNEFPQLKG